MLENILGSRSKIAILRMLSANPKREYTIEEISRAVQISLGTVFPALRCLIETRTILSRKIGRSTIYVINEQHTLFDEIKSLFWKESNVPIIVAKKFTSILVKQNIKNVILFGSGARGEFKEHSDIDILIIYCKVKPVDAVEGAVNATSKKYDASIIPIFLSVNEVKVRLEQLDNFIIAALSEGKILYGDKKWLEL